MKKIINSFILCAGIVLLSSCSGFLDRTPVAEVGSNNFFTSESALINYTNGFIYSYTPSATTLTSGDGNSDIVATTSSTSYYYTVDWQPSQQDGWSASDWKPIYNINYFLAHFREVPDLTEEDYNHYEGTGRFWRAWEYWESFVRKFGATPWYDTPIDADDEEALYKPRDNREYVMDEILEDLNFAADNIYATSDWTNCARVSKYVALALKARICLFEGTFRKYHPEDPSTGQPWQDGTAPERFLRACVDACEELMNSGVYHIVDAGDDDSRQTQYRKLFNSEDSIDYTEIIWAREYSQSMGVSHNVTQQFCSAGFGSNWCLDQDFVQTYLHRDGRRHYEVVADRLENGYYDDVANNEYGYRMEDSYTRDPSVTSEVFTDEVADRDYRLKQQIITPGYRKLVGAVDSLFSPVLSKAYTGYYIIKWNIDELGRENSNVCYNSLPIFRYAEILLNYAEAKCELGEFTQDDWDKTIKVLRERAGVDGSRRSDIDPYLAEYYGGLTDPDLVEIRRERAIELLLEGLRYYDILRWHLCDLLNKTWYGIYIPSMDVPYDLDGNGSLDVCVVDENSADKSPAGVTTIINLSNSNYTLEFGDHGRLIWNVDRYFNDKRYVHPIPSTALEINPALGQNYYWQ